MHRKTAGIALASLALAAAALVPAASASPVLTNAGKAVPVGAEVTGKHIGNVILTTPLTSSITFECSAADFTLKVTANSGTKIAGEIPIGKVSYSGTGTDGDCTSNQGPANTVWNSRLCWETTTDDKEIKDTVVVTGCGAKATFTTTVTGLASCKYAVDRFTGTFLTYPDATFLFSDQVFYREEGGFLCPLETRLDQGFDLTIFSGETLTIS